MTVYVDNGKWKYRGMLMCHMIADTDQELHLMARALGLKHSYWQAPPKHASHYDICQTKRGLAVSLGAIEIDETACMAMSFLRHKHNLPMGDPATARERYRIAKAERAQLILERARAATIQVSEHGL